MRLISLIPNPEATFSGSDIGAIVRGRDVAIIANLEPRLARTYFFVAINHQNWMAIDDHLYFLASVPVEELKEDLAELQRRGLIELDNDFACKVAL